MQVRSDPADRDGDDTPAQAAFRAACRAWLAEHLPVPPPFALPTSALDLETADQLDYLRRWQRAAYDAGLVGCDYPAAYGGRPLAADPRIRDAIVELAIRQRALDAMYALAGAPGFTEPADRIALQHKLLHSELQQDLARLACAIEGLAGQVSLAAPDHGRWSLAYLDSYGFTIAAGSSEVQRNILGERVLGLPKTR